MCNGIPLARFAFEKSSRFYADGRAKPKLFEPNLNENDDMVLSIAKIDGCDQESIIDIGIDAATRNINAKKLVGWAAFSKSDVLEVNESLSISDDNGPEWHAEIVDWPEDTGKHLRVQQDLAKIVNENSGGVLLQEPISIPIPDPSQQEQKTTHQ